MPGDNSSIDSQNALQELLDFIRSAWQQHRTEWSKSEEAICGALQKLPAHARLGLFGNGRALIALLKESRRRVALKVLDEVLFLYGEHTREQERSVEEQLTLAAEEAERSMLGQAQHRVQQVASSSLASNWQRFRAVRMWKELARRKAVAEPFYSIPSLGRRNTFLPVTILVIQIVLALAFLTLVLASGVSLTSLVLAALGLVALRSRSWKCTCLLRLRLSVYLPIVLMGLPVLAILLVYNSFWFAISEQCIPLLIGAVALYLGSFLCAATKASERYGFKVALLRMAVLLKYELVRWLAIGLIAYALIQRVPTQIAGPPESHQVELEKAVFSSLYFVLLGGFVTASEVFRFFRHDQHLPSHGARSVTGSVRPAILAGLNSQRPSTKQSIAFEKVISDLRAYVEKQKITPRTCFISYAWGVPEHERWVEKWLAADLQQSGIQIVYDRKDIEYGDSLSRFVSRISKCDYVVVVGTPLYLKKFENRLSSTGSVVAAEVDLISERLMGTQDQKRTVKTLLLDGDKKTSLPPLMWDNILADFRHESTYFTTAFDLILSLYQLRKEVPVVADLLESLRGSTPS